MPDEEEDEFGPVPTKGAEETPAAPAEPKGKKGKKDKKKKGKGKKDKKGKKGKGKKDLTADRSLESLYAELVEQGIVRPYEERKISEFQFARRVREPRCNQRDQSCTNNNNNNNNGWSVRTHPFVLNTNKRMP